MTRCIAATEQEMRDVKAPTPETLQELDEWIESLVERPHDYGTCVYAMSLAAVAAFNYVAGKLGVSGFQASCADLDILRRTRLMDGPFMLIDGNDMLYPQYDPHERLSEALQEWQGWASEEAEKKLAEVDIYADRMVHPSVLAHWKRLAALAPISTNGDSEP